MSVPPIETFTNSTPNVAYFRRVETRANTVSFMSSAANVMAAGSVMNEPNSGTTIKQVRKNPRLPGSGNTLTMPCTICDAVCKIGRLPATTMMAKTNIGSVKLRLSR